MTDIFDILNIFYAKTLEEFRREENSEYSHFFSEDKNVFHNFLFIVFIVCLKIYTFSFHPFIRNE